VRNGMYIYYSSDPFLTPRQVTREFDLEGVANDAIGQLTEVVDLREQDARNLGLHLLVHLMLEALKFDLIRYKAHRVPEQDKDIEMEGCAREECATACTPIMSLIHSIRPDKSHANCFSRATRIIRADRTSRSCVRKMCATSVCNSSSVMPMLVRQVQCRRSECSKPLAAIARDGLPSAVVQ
jgi:hypothetical protein